MIINLRWDFSKLRNLYKWLNIPSKSIRFLKHPYTKWASTSGTWPWPHCGDSPITQHIKRQMKSTSGKFYQLPLLRRRPSGLLKNYCSKWGHVTWVVPQSSLMCLGLEWFSRIYLDFQNAFLVQKIILLLTPTKAFLDKTT